MGATEQLPEQSKYPAESRLYDFDFSRLLDAGVTLAAAGEITATRTDVAGGQSSLVIGALAVGTPRVQARISGGAAGEVYRLKCTATDSDGDILECDGLLNILA